MSAPSPVSVAQAAATFELLWQQDASAFALVRDADGELSAGELELGLPAVADLALAERGVAARLLELDELLDLVDAPPEDVELGGSALIVLEVLRAARRSVASGLVHPHLEAADGRWHALWGATLDEHVRDELAALAHAAPAAAADAFDGTRTPSCTISTAAPWTSSHDGRYAAPCSSPRRRATAPERWSTSSQGSPRPARRSRPTTGTRRSSDG